MGQAINDTHCDGGFHVSPEAHEVLTKEEVYEIFVSHASGGGDDVEMQRLLKKSDLTQVLYIRSIHETACGARVLVVTEFIFGTTTIDLASRVGPDTGFTRG